MALLGGVYIDTVYGDSVNGSVESTEHQVEQGIDITDHVKPNADTFSISGVIVGDNAAGRRQQIVDTMKKGQPVEYLNRIALYNVIIKSFDSNHDVEVRNGLSFNATLQEIKVSKPAVIKDNQTLTNTLSNLGLQQATGAPTNIYKAKQNDTIAKIAKSKKVNEDKVFDLNRHLTSVKNTRLTSGNNVVIPTL